MALPAIAAAGATGGAGGTGAGAGAGAGGMGGSSMMNGIGLASSVGASVLKTTGTILSMQANANQEINDYKNWAYNNMAMQIQQAQEKAQLQDNQARQSASQQVNISNSGLGLSSSSSLNQQMTTGRAQSQEIRNQNVNQMLQNMEMQQTKNNMETMYQNKSTQAMIGGFSDALNSTAQSMQNAQNLESAQKQNAYYDNKLSGGKNNIDNNNSSFFSKYGKYL